MYRILAGLLTIHIVCGLGICHGSETQVGESVFQNSQGQTVKTERVKKTVGPLEIGGKRIVVILDMTTYEGQEYLYHSFEIRDEAGASSFKEELGSTPESSTAIEGIFKLESTSGEGLIFYFHKTPSAPSSGRSFQIFGIEKNKVKPLSTPVMPYGEVQPLLAGHSPGAVKLFEGDLIKVNVWKGLFGVVIPFVVDFQKLTISPLRTKGIFDIYITYTPNPPFTDVDGVFKLYQDPNDSAQYETLTYKEVKKVEFVKAYADVQFKKDKWKDIKVSNLWLKVKINGREGWLNNADSLVTLGLRPSG